MSAPDAAAAGQGPGELNVQSRPTGARVFVNERLAGSTPLAISDLPAGFNAGMGNRGIDIQLPDVNHAFIALSMYSVVFLFIAFYTFRKRDVT